MAQGKVLKLTREKGYGFIENDGDEDVFFHRSGMWRSGKPCPSEYHDLQEGDLVVYLRDPSEDPNKGPRAIAVERVL